MLKFILKNKLAIILLIIFFTLGAYIFYKDQIVWGGNKYEYYFQYYIIIFIFIIFSLITFFLNNMIKVYITIFSISLLVSLYVSEYYFTFIKLSLKEEAFYNINNNGSYDNRSRFEFFSDKIRNEKNITIVVAPTDYLESTNNNILPLTSKSKTKTIHCNESGNYATYYSDRFGFNNPDNEWNNSIIDYVLIGDSFTHGACVNRPFDVASVLRKVSDKSVINLGVGGNGPLLELAVLKEYLPKNKTKNVIWIYFEGNDPEDLDVELRNKILKKYLENESFRQNLTEKVSIIDTIIDERISNEFSEYQLRQKFFLQLKKLIKLSKLRELFQPIGKDQMEEKLIDKNFKKIISQANKFSAENGAKFYFVYLPEPDRYIIKNFKNKNYKIIQKTILDLDIPLIDLHDIYLKNIKDHSSIFPSNCMRCGHFNEKGYELMGINLYKNLN